MILFSLWTSLHYFTADNDYLWRIFMFKSVQTRAMFYLVSIAISLLIIISFVLVAGIEKIGHGMQEKALEDRTRLLSESFLITSELQGKITPEEAYLIIRNSDYIDEDIKENSFLINKERKTIGYYGRELPYDLTFSKQCSLQNIYKKGEDYIASLASLNQIPGLDGWFVCSEKRYSQVFRDINNIKTGTIIILVILLFILWPLSKSISKKITTPIRELSKSAARIASGDISQGIVTKNKDELADIATSFNLMLNHLKSTMQQVLTKSGETASMHEIMEYAEQAYENLLSGIISINNIGEITTFNEAAEKLIGLKAEEVLGLNVQNPIPKEIKPLIDTLKRCLAKGSLQLKTLDDIYNTSGEKIPILYSVKIQFGLKDEVIGAVCVFRNILDIQRFEESTNRTKNLKALGEMSASLAHEVKNPLTSIRGYAQLAKLELSEHDLNVEGLDIIIHEADRLAQMLDRFMHFARPKIPVLKEVDLRKVINYVITLIQNELPDNIKINTVFKEIPNVMADEELFEPVILNLLLNAIQSMPNGGVITIKTGYNEKRKMVFTEVIDTGQGIPREISERIFEPFFTTKDIGAGMGLAISSRIIEAHKGVLEVESVVKEGAKFTILLQSVETSKKTFNLREG